MLWVFKCLALVVPFLGTAGAHEYAIIIDAGSSGSRLGMYTVDGSTIEEFSPNDTDEDSFKVEPGLSSYLDNPSGAGESLRAMVTAASKYIPQDLQASTKLWVKATAGMRTLNETKAAAVFRSVEDFMTSGDCPFKFMSGQIMSGDEEALFTYLAVNYLEGSLGKPPGQTTGILELGGASFQVIFQPASDVLANEMPYYYNDTLYNVYATSYMFGIDMARERYYEGLQRDYPAGATTIPSPCFNSGDVDDADMSGSQIKFQGTGNSSACLDRVQALLHQEYDCNLPPCPMMGRHVTPISSDMKFVGASNVFWSAFELGLIQRGEEKVVTPSQYKEAVASYCEKTVEEAKESTANPWKYQWQACLKGTLIYVLLQAFGFEDDSQQLTVSSTADWKMGSLLYDLVYMPNQRDEGNVGDGIEESRLYAVRGLKGRGGVTLPTWAQPALIAAALAPLAAVFAVGRRMVRLDAEEKRLLLQSDEHEALQGSS